MIIEIDKIVESLHQPLAKMRSIVIIVHQNPDGDAIGSALALYAFLVNQQHQVDVLVPNEYPFFLKWLPNSDKVLVFTDKHDEVIRKISESEIIFCLDFNEPKRIGKMADSLIASSAVKVLIDHHPPSEPFTDFSMCDTSVSSAAELVYEFMIRFDCKSVDKAVAECIFTGMMTDTGCFNFNSSRPRTYAIVSELLFLGINKDRNFSNVYDNYSVERMKLLGYTLDNKLVVYPDFHAAYISLTKDELKNHQSQTGDTEGFVNYALSIKGIVFSVFFTETDDFIKISLRSKGSFDVNQFSRKHFNGGGHQNAAGGRAYMTMAETLAYFESILPEYSVMLNECYEQRVLLNNKT